MNRNSSSLPVDCQRCLNSVDGGAPPEQWREHAANCESCTLEMEVRNKMVNRLRMAQKGVAVPIGLETRIRAAINGQRQPRKMGWLTAPGWMAAATAFAMVAVLGIAYQLGHLRFSQASQDWYIASVSSRVASILRVGLKDHIHCTVYRKYPKAPPPVESFVAELGPEYRDLVGVVRQQAPSGYQLAVGHKCRYEGRKFVHLALRNGSGKLLSLVIAGKDQGESFATERLPAALNHDGRPFFEAQAQRFAISAFETDQHLVYTVSDLPADQNMRIMVAMAPRVVEILAR
ncbi:MAG: hypothetical protein JNL98_28315 [Bryobacterales bacterium]|nr:hypothetical protein [Bryobacterales bacterium]